MISPYDITVRYGSNSIPMSTILDEISLEDQTELSFDYEHVIYIIINRAL